MAAEYDLNIDQGATFRQNFRWEAGDPPAPVDLTGCFADTAILTVKEAVYDLEITLTNGDVNRLVGGKVFVSPQVTR